MVDRRRSSSRGRSLAEWLRAAAPRRAAGAVNIALVSDRAMRALNRRHRGVDRVTDVLSFPAGDTTPGVISRRRMTPGVVFALGDIAIAVGVARRQAREQGHPLRAELRVLALHGLLHLLGYDHATDRGEMQRVEERLRLRAGLRVGLIARAGRRERRP